MGQMLVLGVDLMSLSSDS